MFMHMAIINFYMFTEWKSTDSQNKF